jgi:hypothetical protein
MWEAQAVGEGLDELAQLEFRLLGFSDFTLRGEESRQVLEYGLNKSLAPALFAGDALMRYRAALQRWKTAPGNPDIISHVQKFLTLCVIHKLDILVKDES